MKERLKEIALVILLSAIIGGASAGFFKFLVWIGEEDSRQDKTTCEQIMKLAEGKDLHIDSSGNCYFIKDGRLEKVEN